MSRREIDLIIARLQIHKNAKTRKETAAKMGVALATFKTWIHKGRIPEQRKEEICEKEGLNIEWLNTGTGPKYRVSEDISHA